MSEEKEQPPQRTFPKFSRSDIMAFAALFVSLAALLVSIYEANIMKEQQLIMQSQQKASVLPYLAQNQISSFGNEKCSFTYKLSNQGLGPAVIKSTQLTLNGILIEDYLQLSKAIKKEFPEDVDPNISFMDLKSRFLPAGEELDLIEIQFDAFKGQYDLLSQLVFNYEFCYCSVFDDCWLLTSEKSAVELDKPCGE
jgi:hypothetical protein